MLLRQHSGSFSWLLFFAPLLALLVPTVAAAAPGGATKETECADGKDNDGDTVFDCGDADCKANAACKPDGKSESTPARCSDWVDNDSDGYVDCEDFDCDGSTACYGSWDRELAGAPASGPTTSTPGGPTSTTPDLTGKTEADLIGQGDDADGERSNVLCSDGIDNDNDGRVDCDDLGCKLDTQVTVCQASGDFRLSLVARVNAIGHNVQENQYNTEFERLQLRVLGSMPFIQNSFFLISARAEKTPRVTFAMFQIPLGKKGHYVNINSGGGGLSLALVRSAHKQLLIDQPFYVYNAFEQGNGAAIEFGGPIDRKGRFLYRTFVAGGSGRFAGNVGGTFFPDGNTRYTWSVGAQAWMNVVGYYNRWDSPFLFTKAPATVALVAGAKFDRRTQEQYPAWNAQFIARWWRLHFQGEYYGKRELEFKNYQNAYNVQLGFLAVQKRLFFAGDFGQYLATDFEDPPAIVGNDLRRQLQELQYRAAAHVYLWRDVFFATVVWRDRRIEPTPAEDGIQLEQDIRLLFTYRW